MEPRGCLASYDPDQDRYTIRCTVQSVHGIRAALADRIFKLPQHQCIAEVAKESFHWARLPSDIETGFTERAAATVVAPATPEKLWRVIRSAGRATC
jgi:hypothetical protein